MQKTKPIFDTVVVRFGGEIGIKAAWTRRLYERRLAANIKAALKHHTVPYTRLVRKFGRFYVKTTLAEEVAEKLSRVFGVSSLSPAIETTSNLSDISSTSIILAKERFEKGNSFAVRCRRVGEHPFKSQEICQLVGQKILSDLRDLKLHVDLDYPKHTLQIEVREDNAYVFTDTTKGAAGLPLGTQPKTICLLKGDISSAVACWMTMKRGCPAVFVHFLNSSLSAKKSEADRTILKAQRLMDWSIGFPRKLYIIRQPQSFHKFIQKQPPHLGDLLCKRLLLRTAEGLAQMKKAEAIVTGDSVQGNPSQTLDAFRIQDDACRTYPILRPLLGLERRDIEEIAGRIGLPKTAPAESEFEVRAKTSEMVEINPREIERIEKEIDIQEIVREALKSLEVLVV